MTTLLNYPKKLNAQKSQITQEHQIYKFYKQNKQHNLQLFEITRKKTHKQQRKMFRSILLTRSLMKFNFSKYIINETNFESIKKQFTQKPEISTFGSYFNYDNALPIFSIVSSAKHLQRTHRIAVLNELQAMCQNEQSHQANSDQGLNLLANIHFHKATELTALGNFQLTVKQLQAAIAIIEIMQNPAYFFLGELHRSRGEAYLRMNDMAKSQHSLLKAESYLKQLLDDLLEQDTDQSNNNNKQAKQQIKAEILKTRVALSHTLTQLGNTFIKESKVYQAKSQMQKAIENWQYVQNFKGIPYYELTIRLKCILHVIFNQRNDAIQSSNELLQYLDDPKTHKHYRTQQQLNLAKIWHMNFIVSNFKEESNSMYLGMKEKWEKRLIQLIKESKETFKQPEFQNIMKSTGLTQEKLAKYGLA